MHHPQALREKPIHARFLTEGVAVEDFSIDGKAVTWDDPADPQVAATIPGGTTHALTLGTPIPPKGRVRIRMRWHDDLVADKGWKEVAVDETRYFLAHVFPRITNDSDCNGWDCAPFTLGREFNNDFADFHVEVEGFGSPGLPSGAGSMRLYPVPTGSTKTRSVKAMQLSGFSSNRAGTAGTLPSPAVRIVFGPMAARWRYARRAGAAVEDEGDRPPGRVCAAQRVGDVEDLGIGALGVLADLEHAGLGRVGRLPRRLGPCGTRQQRGECETHCKQHLASDRERHPGDPRGQGPDDRTRHRRDVTPPAGGTAPPRDRSKLLPLNHQRAF